MPCIGGGKGGGMLNMNQMKQMMSQVGWEDLTSAVRVDGARHRQILQGRKMWQFTLTTTEPHVNHKPN
jgi:hypothetical protein